MLEVSRYGESVPDTSWWSRPKITGPISSLLMASLNAAAILPLTKSGATAHNVSKFRPATPILAITSEINVARRLQLVWGVTPLLIESKKSTTETFGMAMQLAMEIKILKPGDLVVITAGVPFGNAGSTNLLRIAKIIADKDLT